MKLPLALSAAVLSALLPCSTRAAETEVPLKDLPGTVQTAIKKLVGQGEIRKTVKEPGDHGGLMYEVSYSQKGKKFEAEITPEGKVLVVDEEIALPDAPKAVQKTIEEKTAGGKIRKIEKAVGDKETYYEAEFTKAGGKHEVKVSPDGKVLAVE